MIGRKKQNSKVSETTTCSNIRGEYWRKDRDSGDVWNRVTLTATTTAAVGEMATVTTANSGTNTKKRGNLPAKRYRHCTNAQMLKNLEQKVSRVSAVPWPCHVSCAQVRKNSLPKMSSSGLLVDVKTAAKD